MLGPAITSLRSWITQHQVLEENSPRIINEHARRLILLDALREHAELFNQASLWQITEQLLQLFDELSLEQQTFLEQPEADWQQQLEQAYQLQQGKLPQLTREARMVQTLWRAWQEQLAAHRLMDDTRAYIQRLASPVGDHEQVFILLGYDQLSGVEQAWCQQQHAAGKLVYADAWLPSEQQHPQQHLAGLAYDFQQPMAQRAAQLRGIGEPSALMETVSVYSARHGEQEAEAVILQVREWLHQGLSNLAVICEDRKLARRIRALFERDQVPIRDTAGWSLATTSAASVLERWLECIEEDFNHVPLLDLLKSPFYQHPDERETHLQSIYRFEQDIVFHLNIAANIQRYIHALEQRHRQLAHWQPENYTAVKRQLQALEQHAAGLTRLYRSRRPAPPLSYLETLEQSLEATGIAPLLRRDPAGEKLLHTLEQMRLYQPQACRLSWQDFRTWLSNALEDAIFAPQTQAASVHLLNLQQAEFCGFDAVIMAGCDDKNLPGKAPQSPIFNQRVRASLGLQHWSQQKQLRLTRFQKTLATAPRILFTHTREVDGEWQKPSPWLTSLEDLVQLAWGTSLQNTRLPYWLDSPPRNNSKHYPRPAPELTDDAIPKRLSVSQYRRLMHCPYQFYAANGLQLKPEEHVVEQVQKSDYGNLVHTILYAFHQPLKDFMPPFGEPVNRNNRGAALQHLTTLSHQVFDSELEDNIVNRGWKQRWLDLCPAWIDWLIEHRQQGWEIHELEQQHEIDIAANLSLYGRLDRIETRERQLGIIDYKTGSISSKQDLLNGEEVQLLSYSHLLSPVAEVSYVSLAGDKVETRFPLGDDQLDELRQQDWQRLRDIAELWQKACAFPAWGATQVCQYCDMAGVCRKQIWEADLDGD